MKMNILSTHMGDIMQGLVGLVGTRNPDRDVLKGVLDRLDPETADIVVESYWSAGGRHATGLGFTVVPVGSQGRLLELVDSLVVLWGEEDDVSRTATRAFISGAIERNIPFDIYYPEDIGRTTIEREAGRRLVEH
jgi:hypothetical protein